MVKSNKIKILQTIRQGQIGGGETHVLDLVNKLDKNKFHVEVLSFTDGPMIKKLNSMGIKTHVINTEKPFDRKVRQAVLKLVVNGKFDIIHAHGTRAASNVYFVASKLSIPMIYTVHGWSFHKNQNFIIRKLRELSESFLTKRSVVTIAVSESNKLDGIKKFNLKNAQVIYNGIDHEKFNPNRNYPNIREELDIQSNKTVVGYFARITEQKDPFTMVRVMKELSYINKNILLLMVGNGNLLTETKKLASDLGVMDQIIFSDFREDIPAVLQAINIYCLPSLWEGMPIGLLEAMAMGKPCIATAVDGTVELIKEGKNGFLVSTQNPKAIANHILDLHNYPRLGELIANNAKAQVLEEFSLVNMVQKIETLYHQIVTKN